MTAIIEKISQYNLFNYLLPGILFGVIVERITMFSIISDDIVITAFVCYFIGLVISRIGSIVVEPLLEKISFIERKSYEDFVKAEHLDSKISTLSEQNNIYRNLIALFIAIGGAWLFNFIGGKIPLIHEYRWPVMLISLFLMFLLAYRKQTKYIFNRIETNLKKQ